MSQKLSPLVPRIACIVTIAIALCALAGWTFGVTGLKSVLPQEAPIEANTAIALLLSAGALLRLAPDPRRDRHDAQSMAAAVLLLGLATLAQHVFGVDFDLDELFFRD